MGFRPNRDRPRWTCFLSDHVGQLHILCGSGKCDWSGLILGRRAMCFGLFTYRLENINNLQQKETGRKCRLEKRDLPLLQEESPPAQPPEKGHIDRQRPTDGTNISKDQNWAMFLHAVQIKPTMTINSRYMPLGGHTAIWGISECCDTTNQA